MYTVLHSIEFLRKYIFALNIFQFFTTELTTHFSFDSAVKCTCHHLLSILTPILNSLLTTFNVSEQIMQYIFKRNELKNSPTFIVIYLCKNYVIFHSNHHFLQICNNIKNYYEQCDKKVQTCI